MTAPLFARVLGVLALLAGGLGFLPAVAPPPPIDAPVVTLSQHYGLLATMFPVNVATSGLAIFFGLWGLLASLNFAAAVNYCRWLMWVNLGGVAFGMLPITNTFFGIAPLYGHDIWLHLVITFVALFAGYGRASLPSHPPFSAEA